MNLGPLEIGIILLVFLGGFAALLFALLRRK